MPAHNVVEIPSKMDSQSLALVLSNSVRDLEAHIDELEAAAKLLPILDSTSEDDRGILVAGFEAILYRLAKRLH